MYLTYKKLNFQVKYAIFIKNSLNWKINVMLQNYLALNNHKNMIFLLEFKQLLKYNIIV